MAADVQFCAVTFSDSKAKFRLSGRLYEGTERLMGAIKTKQRRIVTSILKHKRMLRTQRHNTITNIYDKANPIG